MDRYVEIYGAELGELIQRGRADLVASFQKLFETYPDLKVIGCANTIYYNDEGYYIGEHQYGAPFMANETDEHGDQPWSRHWSLEPQPESTMSETEIRQAVGQVEQTFRKVQKSLRTPDNKSIDILDVLLGPWQSFLVHRNVDGSLELEIDEHSY